MNENEYFKANDDGIGTDPTTVQVIESLDVLPADDTKKEDDVKSSGKPKKKKSTTKNPDKKPGDLLKKILFTIVILALMAGVSFGVYYYLSLANKTNGKSKFTLEDKIVFVGDKLPTSVIDYGDFSTVDISECSLDVLDVNVNEPGVYDYAVVCGKAKYTAKIIVQERVVFDVEAIPVYKQALEEVTAEEFFKTSEAGYSFTFIDENTVNEQIAAAGGPHIVNIKVTNPNGDETELSSLLYVVNEEATMYLTCNSSKQNSNDFEYTITDKIAFNSMRNNMGVSLRFYNYMYASDAEFELAKSNIVAGKVAINSIEGFALVDNVNNRIKVVNVLTNEMLNDEYGKELPTGYNDINGYYRNTKKYSCSI